MGIVFHTRILLCFYPIHEFNILFKFQAYFAGSDFDLAKKDFEKVCELEPDNKASKNQVKICEQKIKHFEKKEKARYVGMFDKFAAEDAKKVLWFL